MPRILTDIREVLRERIAADHTDADHIEAVLDITVEDCRRKKCSASKLPWSYIDAALEKARERQRDVPLLRIGSLFSGYGGLDIAVRQLFPHSRIAWHCEFAPAPTKILAHHHPDTPNHHDITAVDFTTVEPIELLTGGYPCQPFSAAGQRKGTEDDRHLWPYCLEAIRILRPRYAFFENVSGHRSLGFDRVLADCAAEGFNVRWSSVRASDIGAPHIRERLFIVVEVPADTDDERRERGGGAWRRGTRFAYSSVAPADPDARRRGERTEQPVAGAPQIPATVGGAAHVADTDSDTHRPGTAGCDAAGSDGRRREPRPVIDHDHRFDDTTTAQHDFGRFTDTVRRWAELTRPAPAPTQFSPTPRNPERRILNARFAEWMMGLPDGHVTDVDISRAAQLKAIGNGVCPPQAFAAYSEILDWETP